MMKSYYRYEPQQCLGIISTPDCNAIYDNTGRLVFTGGLQNVGVWNIRQASQTRTLTFKEPNYPYVEPEEVVCLARCPERSWVCAGYSSGTVRIFDYIAGSIVVTFRGHRAAINSLAFDQASGGTLLATGSADCDVIVWDLVSHTGLVRFHEHKDAVTAVAFLQLPGRKLLLSASKDTLLKVWDLDTKHCVQTIVGHRAEIWSLAVLASEDSRRIRVFTGSADELIRGYALKGVDAADSSLALAEGDILVYHGCISRSESSHRCASLTINPTGTLLAAQSSGKVVDLFKIRDEAEVKKKIKRRVKRAKQKQQEKAHDDDDEDDDEQHEAGDAPEQVTDKASSDPTLTDELELLSSLRCSHKVRSFAFSPIPTSHSEDQCLVSLITNSLEIYKISHAKDASAPAKLSIIDYQGHRSDVRGMSLSADGNSLATCSAESIKTWNTRNHSCTGSCAVDGYCLSLCFAPGGRYIIAGFKDGRLAIFDSASGESVFSDSEAHKDAAIWSIATRPDGSGFMTGSADNSVKFWRFEVAKNALQAVLERELVLPSDVLCVRYNWSKSATKLLVAVALLDNTVRIFYDDSLKLFLTLYGHKLPVMCVDMSYDSMILASGSADKTIKLWGLDFGDCHRSLIAHEDSVCSIRFLPQTHYFFSAGKDGAVKYWDADRFEQILLLTGHRGSVWSLEASVDGAFLFSCGQDRSIRVWERSDDLVFVEEERERALEAQVDKDAAQSSAADRANSVIGFDGFVASNPGVDMVAVTVSAESAKGEELLMETIDLVEQELAGDNPHASTNARLLGLHPLKYLQRVLRQIKQPDLEPALLTLPFHYVKRMISLLVLLANSGLDCELSARAAVYLVQCHLAQITATTALLPELLALRNIINGSIGAYRGLIGMNLAGMKFVLRELETQQQDAVAKEEIGLAAHADTSGNLAYATFSLTDGLSLATNLERRKEERAKEKLAQNGKKQGVKRSRDELVSGSKK